MSTGGTAAPAERTAGSGRTGAPVPARLASVYLPAPLPREGRVAFWDPGAGPVEGGTDEITVVRRHGAAVRRFYRCPR